MKIRWLFDTSLEIVTDITNDAPVYETESWEAGDIEEVTLLDERKGYVNFQFGDGSCAYGVDTNLFEIVELDSAANP